MKTLFIVIAVVFSNLAGGGWIMTDEESGEILGFSESGTVECSHVPEGLREMIGLRTNGEGLRTTDNGLRTTDNGLRSELQRVMAAGNVVVAPLLGLKWGQGELYNSECPVDATGQGGHVQVGCGALVMGQIMRYWRYPTNGTGSHSYNCTGYGTQSANFGNTTYDYNNMPTSLTGASSSTKVNAVATLLYHCGVAVEMHYGASASTAQSGKMVSAMSTYFKYPATIEYIEKADYSNTQWHQILQGELDDSAPFFYGASGSYGGHVFICDGYRDDNYYHLVWGWYGSYDGWFKIGSFNPGPYDFNWNHAAIIGIRGPEVPSGLEYNENEDENENYVVENPVRGMMWLDEEHVGEIYDMTGRCVMRFEGECVNVSSLVNGVYYLRVETGKSEVILIEN